MRHLKIESLPSKNAEAWVEHDIVMLHACFQILVNFVEKDGYALIDKEFETSKDFCNEVDTLYNWWQQRKLKVYPESVFENNDQTMLKRLIEIRESIWV